MSKDAPVDVEKGQGAASSSEGSEAAVPGHLADGSDADGRHYWEAEIFAEHKLSDKDREGFAYSGPLLWRSNPPPLLLAKVQGTDHEGRPFHWVARRHRKRVLHPHQLATPAPPISWLGWLDAPQHWRKLGWWIGLLFTLGSVLFVISGVAGEVTAVADLPERQVPGLTSLYAGLIAWPNVVAANLCFFPAGLIQMLEATNMDYDQRVKAWEKQQQRQEQRQEQRQQQRQQRRCRRQAPKPHRRLLPTATELESVSWWGAAIQLAGMLGFNLATIATLASCVVDLQVPPGDLPKLPWSPWLFLMLQHRVKYWTVNFGFTFGGGAFTVSTALFGFEATGSWWRAAVPSRLCDLRSISWHTAFWNIHGSIGFLIWGAATYATSFSWTQMQWISGYGNLGGAVWFLLSALAALLEQANPGHP